MLLPIISDFTGNGNFGEKKGGPAGCLLPADMKKKYFKKIAISFMVLSYRTVVTIICLKNEKFVHGLCKRRNHRKGMTIRDSDDILGIDRKK